MDICDLDGEEICPIQEKVKTSDDKDLISDLPDDILVRILSFLPVKGAIKTILLRRFGDLWRSIQVLDFGNCLYHDLECMDRDLDVIRYVLNHHRSSTLDRLCLKFCFTLTYSRSKEYGDGFEYQKEWEKATVVQIDKLIQYSISRKVKVLDANFKACYNPLELWELYDLPDVLSSNHLTCLKLAALNITSCTKIDLKSLRVLLLDDVLLSDEIMEIVLLGCPLLEDLSLIDCYGLSSFLPRNPNLKKVMLSLSPKEDKPLEIACPYVLSLGICGRLPRASLIRALSIVDASVYYSNMFRCKQQQYHSILRLLQNVSLCKTFSPCTWTILVFTIWNFTKVPCPSFEWTNLILKVSLSKWHHPGLSLLLRSSKSLETLTMHIYPSTLEFFFKSPDAKWIEAYEFDIDEYWDSQVVTFPFLETIMIYVYVNEPCVVQLVKFLLRSATGLKKLVISTKQPPKPTRERLHQFTSEQLQELSQKIESLPRASPELKGSESWTQKIMTAKRRRYEENEDDAAWEKRVHDHLEMLIAYALRKQVKVMEFDLMDGNKIRHRDECYDLPDVLSSEYLTQMTLSAVDMRLCKTTNLSSLKVMLLNEVTLNDNVMIKVLSGCPLLEELSLIECYGLKTLVCENPDLKNVMLTLTFKERDFLTVSCPYVLSLYIDGWAERVWLTRISPTVDISIYLCRFSCTTKQPGVLPLLRKASQCNTFRPCSWTILVFTIWNYRNVCCPSFKWKKLILKLGIIKWHHPGLSLLLRNSRSLETLTMYIYPRSSRAVSAFKEPAAKWIEAYDFDLDKFWDSQEASFPDLKTITINGYLNQPCVIDMVKFLLTSASSLQKLVISKNLPKLTRDESYDLNRATEILQSHFTSKQLLKFPNMFTSLPRPEKLQELVQKFKSLPRASTEVEIYFI